MHHTKQNKNRNRHHSFERIVYAYYALRFYNRCWIYKKVLLRCFYRCFCLMFILNAVHLLLFLTICDTVSPNSWFVSFLFFSKCFVYVVFVPCYLHIPQPTYLDIVWNKINFHICWTVLFYFNFFTRESEWMSHRKVCYQQISCSNIIKYGFTFYS